jgi:hypothetical protein
MALTLKTNQLTFIYKGSLRNTNDFTSNAAKFSHDWAIALANGTGSGYANYAYQDQLTINASSSTTLDLTALTDEFGVSRTFTKVKVLAIRLNSSSDTAATLNVGAAATNIFSSIFADSTDIVKVRYQGWVVFACKDATGYAVSGTVKSLKIANNSASNSVTVDVVIVGEI